MKENSPHRSNLEINDAEYFKFSLPDDTGIEKIAFTVTAISGDIEVYISRNESIKYPTSENADRVGFWEKENY